MSKSAMHSYQAPMTGGEKHISGMEVFRQQMFHKEVARHKKTIKTMKSAIDTSCPRALQGKFGTNRSKKEAEFRRFSEIERENYRLLDRMSKIMVRGPAESIFGVHQHVNCPALDFQKARDRRHAQVHEENKMLLKRIVSQQPYYSNKEFAKHAANVHRVISHKCKYENKVFPLHAPRRREEEPDINESMNAQVRATVAARASLEGTLPIISERGPVSKKDKKGGSRSASVPLLGATISNSPDLSELDAKMQRKKGAGRTDAPPKRKKLSTTTMDDVPSIPEDANVGALKPSSPGSRPPTGGVVAPHRPLTGGVVEEDGGTGKAKTSVVIQSEPVSEAYAEDFE